MGTWALLLLVLLTATRWFLLVGKGTALAYVAVLVCLPTLAVLSALFELRGILQTAELGEATYRWMADDWCHVAAWCPTSEDPLRTLPARAPGYGEQRCLALANQP